MKKYSNTSIQIHSTSSQYSVSQFAIDENHMINSNTLNSFENKALVLKINNSFELVQDQMKNSSTAYEAIRENKLLSHPLFFSKKRIRDYKVNFLKNNTRKEDLTKEINTVRETEKTLQINYFKEHGSLDYFYESPIYFDFLNQVNVGNCSEMSDLLSILLKRDGIDSLQVSFTEIDHRIGSVLLPDSSRIFLDPWAGLMYTEDKFKENYSEDKWKFVYESSNSNLSINKTDEQNLQPQEHFQIMSSKDCESPNYHKLLQNDKENRLTVGNTTDVMRQDY
jgi:hypothetical protein